MKAFFDIIGHHFVKKILLSDVNNQSIGNFYLFYGPDGVGKFTTAKSFVKLLSCNKGGCGECLICKGIENESFVDLKIIRPSGKSITLQEAKATRESVYYKPIWGLWKFYIIDEADKLTYEAQNALLKILEEPPAYGIFFLITSNLNALLTTIVSRAKKIKFSLLKEEEVFEILKKILASKEERFLKFLAKLSFGSVKRALDLYKSKEFYQTILVLLSQLDQKNYLQISCQIQDMFKEKFQDFLNSLLFIFYFSLLTELDDFEKRKALLRVLEIIKESKREYHVNLNLTLIVDKLLLKLLS